MIVGKDWCGVACGYPHLWIETINTFITFHRFLPLLGHFLCLSFFTLFNVFRVNRSSNGLPMLPSAIHSIFGPSSIFSQSQKLFPIQYISCFSFLTFECEWKIFYFPSLSCASFLLILFWVEINWRILHGTDASLKKIGRGRKMNTGFLFCHKKI